MANGYEKNEMYCTFVYKQIPLHYLHSVIRFCQIMPKVIYQGRILDPTTYPTLFNGNQYIGKLGCSTCLGYFGVLGNHDQEQHNAVEKKLEEAFRIMTYKMITSSPAQVRAFIEHNYKRQIVLETLEDKKGKDGISVTEPPVAYYAEEEKPATPEEKTA